MMDELGFYQNHTRFWADLPTDDELYKNPGQIQGKKQPGSLSLNAAEPGFPLSGPEHPADLYIPLGMTYIPDSQRTTTTLTNHPPENRLERDGLKDFSADLFLEKELMDLGSNRLAVEANQMQFQDHPHKELTGLHSLWSQWRRRIYRGQYGNSRINKPDPKGREQNLDCGNDDSQNTGICS